MRSVRSRLLAAFGGLAVAAFALSGPLAPVAAHEDTTPADAAPAAPAPLETEPAIESVTLEPHFFGEPSWPSTIFPTAALRIAWAQSAPIPGDSFSVDLSAGLVASATAGEITDDAGVPLAAYAVSENGSRITITYAEAAGSVVNLSGTLGIFVSTDIAGPTSTTFTGTATIDGTAYPLSTPITGMPWSTLNTIGTWTTGPEGAPRFVARAITESESANREHGGEWVGVGSTADWPGSLVPTSGSTRVFAFEELPDTLAAFSDPTAMLTLGDEYTLDEADTQSGHSVFGVTVPEPADGYLVVEQQFDLVEDGGVLFLGPNTALPDAARRVFATGTAVASGTVDAHAGIGTDTSVSRLTSLTYFAGSGGSATSDAIELGLTLTRDTSVLATGTGTASATTTLTLRNTGNATVDVAVSDAVTTAAASATLRDANASLGAAAIDGSTVHWTARLSAGETSTLTYSVDARATSTSAGSVTFSGSAVGVAASNATLSVPASAADGTLAVTGLPVPVDPVDPVDPVNPALPISPPSPTPQANASAVGHGPTLARTGAAEQVVPVGPIAAAIFLTGGVFALAARRRRRL